VQYVPPHRGGGLGELGKDVEVALNAACPVRAAHVPLAKGAALRWLQMQSDRACLGRRCWKTCSKAVAPDPRAEFEL